MRTNSQRRWVGLLGLGLVLLGGWCSLDGEQEVARAPEEALRQLDDAGFASSAEGARSQPEATSPSDPDDTITGTVLYREAAVPNAEVRLFEVSTLTGSGQVRENAVECGADYLRVLNDFEEPGATPLQRVMTDADGRFIFHVDRGASYTLTARAGDLREFIIPVKAGQQWTVALAPLPRLEGTVLFPDGGVVAGAQVAAMAPETGELMHATTDATGTFAFAELMSAKPQLRIEAPGFLPLVMSRPRGALKLVRPAFPSVARVNGVGVGGARVTTPEGVSATSASDGSFVLEGFLCNGQTLVTGQLGPLKGQLFAGREITELELTELHRLTVVLISSSAELAARAQVSLESIYVDALAPSGRTQSTASFDELTQGDWRIKVSGAGISGATRRWPTARPMAPSP